MNRRPITHILTRKPREKLIKETNTSNNNWKSTAISTINISKDLFKNV